MTRSKILVLLTLAGVLDGCTRPTQQESTYRLNLENKFSWQGSGPDIRWYWPWYTMYVVSHQQEIQNFPLIRGENARIPQIELEKLQSIITADGQIMIQEMSITIYKKADPTAVERFYIQHQEEDRENLAINLDGLVRTYLQTKTKAYIESHQPQLGQRRPHIGGEPARPVERGADLAHAGPALQQVRRRAHRDQLAEAQAARIVAQQTQSAELRPALGREAQEPRQLPQREDPFDWRTSA